MENSEIRILVKAIRCSADEAIEFAEKCDSAMNLRCDLNAAVREMCDFSNASSATVLYYRVTGRVAPRLIQAHASRVSKRYGPARAAELHREWLEDNDVEC